MDGAVGLVASIPASPSRIFLAETEKSLVKGFFHLFPRHVHRRRTADLRLVPRRDARRPVAGLYRHHLLNSGFNLRHRLLWALVPEVIAYGELKSGKRNAAIINAIMGLSSSRSASPSAARSRCGCWRLYGFNESGAVQSASAIDRIIMTAVWIPIALAAISMVIMQVYPISR